MFELLCVVERTSMVSDNLRIACFSNIEGRESIDCHERREMHSIAVSPEHVLMEQKVCAKEDQGCLEVDNGRVSR